MIRNLLITFLLLLALPLAAASNPNTSRGFAPDAVYEFHGVDTINTFNGGLNVSIPLGSTYLAGDRLSYAFTLTYNSAIWDLEQRIDGGFVATEAVPARLSNAGVGWMVTLGELFYHDGLVYVGPDGSEHTIRGTSVHFGQDRPTDPGGDASVRYSRSGDYLRIRKADTATDVIRIVDLPDGVSKEFLCVAHCGPFRNGLSRFQLQKITDAFGNHVTIARDAEPQGVPPAGTTWKWTVREMLESGKTTEHFLTFRFNADAPYRWIILKLELEITTPSFTPDQGITQRRWATYSFNYAPDLESTVYRPDEHTAPFHMTAVQPGAGPLRVPILRGLTLPDTSKWDFRYRVGTAAPGIPAPALRFADKVLEQLVYPTGGGVLYQYMTYKYPREACFHPSERDRIPTQATSTGVNIRQLVKPDGTADGKPWRYLQRHFGGHTAPQGSVCFGSHTFVNTVVDPSATVTVNYFNTVVSTDNSANGSPRDYGLPFAPGISDPLDATGRLSTRMWQCPSTDPFDPLVTPENEILGNSVDPTDVCGNAIRETWVRYESSGDSCDWANDGNGPACTGANRRVASHRTVYLDDGNSWRKVESAEFDGLGHFREIQRSGNFHDRNAIPGSRPRGDLKVLKTRWNPLVRFDGAAQQFSGFPQPSERWILVTYDLMTEEERVTATGEPQAKGGVATSEYFFDDRGFLTQKRTLAGAARSRHDLLTVYARIEEDGRVRITERNHGGDGAGLSTGNLPISSPGTADYAIDNTYRFGSLEKREYKTCSGASTILLAERNELDPATGRTMSTRDASGATTAFLYDEMGRLREIRPPGEAKTTIAYTPAVPSPFRPAFALMTGEDGSSTTPQTKYEYDSYGRLAATLNRLPPAPGSPTRWNRSTMRYDELGRKIEQSTAGPDGSTNLGITFYKYDAFGRVVEKIHPDNDVREHKTTWTHAGERATTQTVTGIAINGQFLGSATTTELQDSQGRLVSVTENSDGAQRTTYDFDSSDRLVKVTAGPQVRTYEYDNRGFRLREKDAELGPNGITFGTFDARGHAHDVYFDATSPRHELDMSFKYDGAERLTLISQPAYQLANGDARPLKSFEYFATAAAGAHQLGKLRRAQRYNYVYDPAGTGNARTVAVTEAYTYWPSSRRLRSTRVMAPGVRWETKFTYTNLGDIASIEHAQLTLGCAPSANCFTLGPGRTVTNTYTFGFLRTVPGFVNDITYHSNGMEFEVKHANNVTWRQDVPLRNLARPTHLQIAGATNGENWDSGTYKYDAAGNIFRMGSDEFTYDAVGRLVKAALSGETQRFAYDRHGNHTTFPGTTITPSPATNRLPVSVASYDDGGNLISYKDPRQTKYLYRYEYDPFNMLRHMTAWNGPAQALGRMFLYNAHDERVATIDYIAARPQVVETWSARDAGNRVIRDFQRKYDAHAPLPGGRDPAARGWTWTHDYVFRGRTLAASVDAAGTTHVDVDHLGSPRVLSNAAGAASPVRSYKPFGQEVASTASTLRLAFTGHERDEAGGDLKFGTVDYMHARYYNPRLGRFLSVDPGDDTDLRLPQSLNRYAYVRNSPMGRTDPDGRKGNLREAGTHKANNNPCTGGDSAGSSGGCGEQAELERRRQAAAEELRARKKAAIEAGGLNPSGEADRTTDLVDWKSVYDDAEGFANIGMGWVEGIAPVGVNSTETADIHSVDSEYQRKAGLVDKTSEEYRAGHALGMLTNVGLTMYGAYRGGKPTGPKPRIRGRYGDGKTIRWEPWRD
jgi:RHS repeat-associated protein